MVREAVSDDTEGIHDKERKVTKMKIKITAIF
jgi:hypothetical protein